MIDLLLAQTAEHWLTPVFEMVARRFPDGHFFSFHFNLQAMLALILVSVTCGAVGALVVGGRMAFFSDALAHCAFASVSIGFVVFFTLLAGRRPETEFWDWLLAIMVGGGLLFAFGIVYVRERTGLASDTIIGVFFAGAIGLTAFLSKIMQDYSQSRQLFRLEQFLFGDPLTVRSEDIVYLGLMGVLTLVVLGLTFNHLLLSGFNTSLALSRRVPIRLVSYLFIMLLAVVVNLSVRTVGVLLINALLVVPAATAANLSRNLRQVFWLTIVLSLGTSLLGQAIAWEADMYTRGWQGDPNKGVQLGISGTIILLNVIAFTVSAIIGPMLRERKLREPLPAQAT
jgi:zinc transport system permease protein